MALENLTTFSSFGDECTGVTLSGSAVTFSDFSSYSQTCLKYKDYGENYFSGDFTHRFTINISSTSTGDNLLYPWTLANAITNRADLHTANTSLQCYIYTTVDCNITLKAPSGTETYNGLVFDTDYYIEIERDESVGTYGTLYLRIYTDSGYTNLLHTLEVVLGAKYDYRYLYCFSGYDAAWDGGRAYGSFSDYNLALTEVSGGYGFEVYIALSPPVDYSSKVSVFEITDEMESFCKEMNLTIVDEDLYDQISFSTLPSSPQVTIYTQTGVTSYLQGSFFIEKVDAKYTGISTIVTIWGRSKTALLGEPFAGRVSKEWTQRTTLYDIVEEMCDMCGLVFNSTSSDVDDFAIYEDTFSVEGEYPIDVIRELLELGYGPDAFVCTNRSDEVILRFVERSPEIADHPITDIDVVEFGVNPEYPEYGNRINIVPAEKYALYYVNLFVDHTCLNLGGMERTSAYARVTDGAENPINGVIVDWLINPAVSSLVYENQKTITRTVVISNEVAKADSFNSIKVKFPPDSVIGVWAYADIEHETNLIAGGYQVEEDYIYLYEALEYCDQLLVVSYLASGIGENTVYIPEAVPDPEDVVSPAPNPDPEEPSSGGG